MERLHIITAGESHGRGLVVTVAGLPSGLVVDRDQLNRELGRRQAGYGRGDRMRLEMDEADFVSGVRLGVTLGSPVAILVWNRDWPNWQEDMATWREDGHVAQRPPVRRPRPGHADLAGACKYGFCDLRNVLERASARETAARVAVGGLCKQLLSCFGVTVRSQVLRIGPVETSGGNLADDTVWQRVETSPVRCADEEAGQRMMEAIDDARDEGDTLGGIGEVVALGVPPGIGGYASWNERLDAALAWAAMSIPSVKAVAIGAGWECAGARGSEVHDAIVADAQRTWGFAHTTNRAGGIEGGMSNGEPILVRLAFKPIPTLIRPLGSLDLDTGKAEAAHAERSDVCVVPAACVVGEAMIAVTLADMFLAKFGGDSLSDTLAAYRHYFARLKEVVGRDQ